MIMQGSMMNNINTMGIMVRIRIIVQSKNVLLFGKSALQFMPSLFMFSQKPNMDQIDIRGHSIMIRKMPNPFQNFKIQIPLAYFQKMHSIIKRVYWMPITKIIMKFQLVISILYSLQQSLSMPFQWNHMPIVIKNRNA